MPSSRRGGRRTRSRQPPLRARHAPLSRPAPRQRRGRIANEPGRARLLWSERGGGYHVPFTSGGARADDSALDRVLARLDLGGALPIAITLVFVALALLAYAALRPTRLAAPSALVAALVAYAAIVWAY